MQGLSVNFQLKYGFILIIISRNTLDAVPFVEA